MATTNSSDSDSILLNQIVNQGVNIYGSREKIRSALIEYAKKYLNLQDTDIRKTSYLAYLIDQISILSANHIFYDSTIYKEFFFTEAQLNESVYNLAKWIGYIIPKATPAQVKVMFGIPLDQTAFTTSRVTFNISPYFYVRSTDDIPFIIKSNSLDSEKAASASVSYGELPEPAMKGEIISNNSATVKDSDGVYQPVYISKDKKTLYFNLTFVQKEVILNTYEVPNDLSVNQFYNIGIQYNGQVCDIEVYVISPSFNQTLDITSSSIDGALDATTFNPNEEIYDTAGSICTWTKWEEAVNGIYTMSSRANQYCWVGGYNSGRLMFGNGVLGKQPPAGSIIAVKLHVTRGSQGNIVPKTITSGDTIYVSTLPGESTSLKYTVMNPSSAYGGTDLLTLPEIKQNAIVNLASKNRLVSDQDYDDIQTILGNDLPINDCCPILKRSDIKVNEIMTFTTLNYITDSINEVVPTRNAKICLKNVEFDDDGKYVMMRNTLINQSNSNVGNDDYLTIFNLTLNKNNLSADYDYILQNVDGSAVKMYSRLKDNYWEQFTYMQANSTSFKISTNKTAILNNSYPLDITFNVNHVPKVNNGINEDNLSPIDFFVWNVDRFQCKMVTKWGNNDTYDCSAAYGYKYETDTDEETGALIYRSFGWTIDNYLDVPEGMQRFEFQLQCYAPVRDTNGNILATDGSIAIYASEIENANEAIDNIKADGRKDKVIQMGWQTIRVFYTDIVVRRNLSDFMTSSISFEKPYENVSLKDLTNSQIYNLIGKEIAESVTIDLSRRVVTEVTRKPILLENNRSSLFLENRSGENIVTLEPGTPLTEELIQSLVANNIQTLKVRTGDINCYVHNVPVILKKYYDDVIALENSKDISSNVNLTNNFELTVMQELIQNMYFNDRKMLTDFINVKFSDTYGPMYNLRYNTPQYFVESRYDNTPWWDSSTQTKPEVIVNPDYKLPADNASNIYFIVNNHINKSDIISDTDQDLQLNDYIGYIALRIVNGEPGNYKYQYQLIEPSRGMFIKVKDELDVDGYLKTLVWNGRLWKDVSDYTIPLEIKLKVEVNEKIVSKSDETITKEIIEALTGYFKNKIGIQKNIDRSEIIRVCRSVTGVVYAELLNPEFDIRFDYEIKDLTQKQLIDYTPQYIGFRGLSDSESDYGRSSINVQIVRV